MVGTTGSHGHHSCCPSSPFCLLSSISLSFCFLRKEFAEFLCGTVGSGPSIIVTAARVAAVVWVQSLTQELARATGTVIFKKWSSLVAQCVKDSVLSLQRLRSLLWHKFDPWPQNFCIRWVQPKKKKKKKKKMIGCVFNDSTLGVRAGTGVVASTARPGVS